MGGDYRTGGILQDIVKGFVGNVSHINKYPQAVHFCNQFPAERAYAVPSLFPGGTTVTNFVVSGMCQGNVANPHSVKKTQQRKVFVDGTGILHAQEDGYLTLLLQCPCCLGIGGQRGQLRILAEHIVHRGKCFQRFESAFKRLPFV